MGMFDYVRSSYNLGPQFTDVELQTKDIEEGYSGTMTHFWIDPAGYLWCPDYKGTNTFEIIEKDDPRYDSHRLFLNYEWISTGQKGKYKVHSITKYVEVYPSTWSGSWYEWPRLKLHFIKGRLVDYEDITKERINNNIC